MHMYSTFSRCKNQYTVQRVIQKRHGMRCPMTSDITRRTRTVYIL